MSDHTTQSDAPRRVSLSISRVDPWSTMKVTFLLSVALGIALVVATIVIWLILDAMHVFSTIEQFMTALNADSFLGVLEFMRLPRVTSFATIAAIANVIILTAISTVAALLYNVVASRWVFLDGALQEVVELASGGFLLAPSIDIKGKIK